MLVAKTAINTRSMGLSFTDDGTQIVHTIVVPDPKGLKVQIKTWDGSPRKPRP